MEMLLSKLLPFFKTNTQILLVILRVEEIVIASISDPMALILQYGSTSKKRPNNIVIGRTYDHHIYDLVEVGVENFKPMSSFTYDKKVAPHIGSKPFIAFIGEGFESVDELKHLKEVLLDLLRGEVCLCHFSVSIHIFSSELFKATNRSMFLIYVGG